MSKSMVTTVCMMLVGGATAWSDCRKFKNIYADGKDLCENMWDNAFKYETDEDNAYTMWWFDAGNPNDATAAKLGDNISNCTLQYYHKEGPPTAEGDNFTECHPWKENACCHESTVTSAEALREGYGAGYEWDRCGPMSQECERFFVQEACFYECEPTAGAYRRCSDAEVAAASDDDVCAWNTWQMWKMPIKASYCDAWYTACSNDYFSAVGNGSYFSAAEDYWSLVTTSAPTVTPSPTAVGKTRTKKETPTSVILMIVFICIALVLVCGLFCITVSRESAGKPLFFQPLPNTDSDGYPKETGIVNAQSANGGQKQI